MNINFWFFLFFLVVCSSLVLILALFRRVQVLSQTNRKLWRRVTELKPIMELNEDGILLLDNTCSVVTANHAFAGLVKLDSEEMIGKTAVSWPENGPSILDRIQIELDWFRQICASLQCENDRLKETITIYGPPDRYYERILRPVFIQGQFNGWLFVMHDVTEVQALAQMREDMTHMLVHDLRSPLSVILGSIETAQVWLESDRFDEIERLFQIARSSGLRLLDLLNDLLDMYKLESGELALSAEPFPVMLLLDEAKTQFLPLAEDAGIQIEIDVMPDVPMLMIDVEYVRRTMMNLLDNAVKYAPDNGRIRLWARMDEKQSSDPAMLVGVSDNGPGIKPDLHQQVFKKFRHDRRQRRQRRGTGLGLPYCRLVVEAHHGRIWVESDGTYETGSTFIMRLPVVVDQVPA